MFTSDGGIVSLCTTIPLIRGASAFAMYLFRYLYLLNLDRESTLLPPAQIIIYERVAYRCSGKKSCIFWDGWIIRLYLEFNIILQDVGIPPIPG